MMSGEDVGGDGQAVGGAQHVSTVSDELDSVRLISELKARYFRFVDTKDWSNFRALFTEQATLFFPEGGQQAPQLIDEILPHIRDFLEDVVSIHHGHMPEIEVYAPDQARGIWAMEDTVFWPPHRAPIIGQEYMHGYGHYHEEYVRRDGKWLIDSLRLTRLRLERRLPTVSVN